MFRSVGVGGASENVRSHGWRRQAYREVLAAVFGSATHTDTAFSQIHRTRLKPVTNSQVKGFRREIQEEAFFERRNTPQDLH